MTDSEPGPDSKTLSTSDENAFGPSAERRRKRSRKKGRTFDAKSLDRYLRISFAFPEENLAGLPLGASPKKVGKKNKQTDAHKDDFIRAHVSGFFEFAKDSHREDAGEFLNEIAHHPALAPVDVPGKISAAAYIFQARVAYRLKTDARYWVLDGLGSDYPHPFALRAGVFPSWKRQIRSLETTRQRLWDNFADAAKAEHGVLATHDWNKMPAQLLQDALKIVERVLGWMEAFPDPVELRSKFREIVRPDADRETVGVMAYVLDRIYRERVSIPMKAKEIECRIAELETKYLGENIHYDPDDGCAAVRLQIRAFKRSSARAALDAKLTRSLRKSETDFRNNDPKRGLDADMRFWARYDRHVKAHDKWRDETTSRLDQDMRRLFKAANFEDQLAEALDNRHKQVGHYIDLEKRWLAQERAHLDKLKAPNVNVSKYGQEMRKWMRRWESTWELYGSDSTNGNPSTAPHPESSS